MDATFITIHDLSREARILYSSDSIVDILGHTPDEVVGQSCWEFFHPTEVDLAKQLHTRGVKLDKAAVLTYCNIRNRDGQWVCCECCFSIVYDVMVCCTSIYRSGMASQKRAAEAPIVRRLFSSSPLDPRYHMLSHLSSKFQQGPQEQTHEPRAALFLNRFTRTLTIMYATAGIEQIIGIPGEAMKGKSFYYCIQQNCLEDAVRCLESAKGNDSIAYLRFWFRNPLHDDENQDNTTSSADDTDDMMTDVTSSDDELDATRDHVDSSFSNGVSHNHTHPSHSGSTSSGNLAGPSGESSTHHASSSDDQDSTLNSPALNGSRTPHDQTAIEIEAVVSCTSDGLVVCLRRARPALPAVAQPQVPAQPTYTNGLFAAPWAPEPVFVPALQGAHSVPPAYPTGYYGNAIPGLAGPTPFPYQQSPAQINLMESIRDVAVFAWALVGINGSLQDYSRGKATGESQPHDFPIWQPKLPPLAPTPLSGYGSGQDPFGDPGLSNGNSGSGSSRGGSTSGGAT